MQAAVVCRWSGEGVEAGALALDLNKRVWVRVGHGRERPQRHAEARPGEEAMGECGKKKGTHGGERGGVRVESCAHVQAARSRV